MKLKEAEKTTQKFLDYQKLKRCLDALNGGSVTVFNCHNAPYNVPPQYNEDFKILLNELIGKITKEIEEI